MTEALAWTANETVHRMGLPFDVCPGIFACNENPLPGTPISRAKQQTGLSTQLLVCGVVGAFFFLLFCTLRIRWPHTYSPRLSMKKHAPPRLPNSLFGWIWPLWNIPHSVVLNKVGLDAVVLLQFLMMGAKLFGLCGLFGTVVLLPVSHFGGDIANITEHKSPASDNGHLPGLHAPAFLWVYLAFTYFICFATFFFTFQNYCDYVSIRREFLQRISRKLPARTVLVTSIPPELRSDRKLAEYFESLDIGTVESVHLIRHFDRLLNHIKDRVHYLRKLEATYTTFWGNPCKDSAYDPDKLLAEAEQDDYGLRPIDWAPSTSSTDSLPVHADKTQERPRVRDGFLGLFGKSQDAITYYTHWFNLADEMVAKTRQMGKFPPTSVGFVTFESSASANIASQVLITSSPFQMRVQNAPEPRDVLWENIGMHNRERIVRKALIGIVVVFLVFFWVIPISYFSALTSEGSLKTYFPWLIDLASKNKILHQIVQNFLPTLAVVIFMAILPLIFTQLSIIEGYQTRSEAEESTFSKQFFFLLFNVLLAFTVTSALFKTPQDIIEDPKKILMLLATNLPQVAPFFVNYTVLQGMMLLPFSLLNRLPFSIPQAMPVIIHFFWSRLFSSTPRDYAEMLAPREFNFGMTYPIPVFMFVVLLVYSTCAPLILVFGAFYYIFAYLVFKYQLLYVFFRPYEVAGRTWPKIFSRIIVGLLIFEILSSGLFMLHHAYVLAALCSILVFFTVAFKMFMDKTYLKSTIYLPQKVDALPDACECAGHDPQPSAPANAASATTDPRDELCQRLRRRRTVLDQDDYIAEPTNHTDFSQPPMSLVDGILCTGMKRYSHPAMVGVLPYLWLPVRPKATTCGTRGIVNHRSMGADEQQPLLASRRARRHPNFRDYADTADADDGEENVDDGYDSPGDYQSDDEGIYYHHPEHRQLRANQNPEQASYGAL